MSCSISLSFPDGSKRNYPAEMTGLELAESISKSLAKKAVAYSLDGITRDLSDSLGQSGQVEIITREDSRALELIRHDCAHVLAEAVQELFPETQVTIGPVIENGFYYDFARQQPFTLDDLTIIEKKMREIIQRNKPFRKEIWSREKARRVFSEKKEFYKVELINSIPDNQDLKIYYQGEWFDLCRGPHMQSTGQIGNAFKLMKVAGAYWRGDANNPMLTRIYGTAFANENDLKAYLHMLEEAEKRDHRRLGREMDLFHFQEEGPGMIFWHQKGWKMFQNLINYMRRRLDDHQYAEVNAPQVLDRSLWEISGHWGWYKENMFKAIPAAEDLDHEHIYALKPMNCPGHVQIFKHGLKSYRDLPIRLAEFGLVHRYEPSGSLHGLMRVRSFTQDDAHIFCTDEQLAAECLSINDLILSTYADFGFKEISLKLSTRPEKRVGSDALWDHAESIMESVLKTIETKFAGQIKTSILPGEGAFYGPKFEYTLKDAIGREWQCGTTQLDFNLPERFGAFYIDKDSEKRQPVMIHRAIFGSMERFLGILIENFAGHMPLWLAPEQIVVATITSEANEYAQKITARLKAVGLSATTDLRNEKINYKIREHSLQKVPVILVCGKREAETNSVNMRRLGSPNQTLLSVEDAIKQLSNESTPPDLQRVINA
ncbi:threonine--tRNA ligase [Bartonella tribocorum]|uniref:Threonine--tRNA ligase n=1 Tax=Bartonella tribocorum (strain DSM 28219 / CCUG 45778 / CIP 105476 / IBS 506) TaxID=382640 RepID=SYT_BART1|nr:threonine--tRNA ligase [Bartonella tribocorum]A9IVB0.1 RecName: Full=Threonine--tRNA ligase; AltName: Full=Threonyl-tRNA synthetase; Short=ThrRS [Bartonella tribocorum CIP 105476]CAK01670.1 Threonyl-tRNA synthetase [Bartonella tribocorum CIP 105476]CDO48916.1 threonyl-tRNA synthetase [Bartonella tribocorum]